jgi:hypothetical protein
MAAVKQEVQKGLAAIKAATERKGGNGEFKPFCPEIRWGAGDEKNLLILSDLEELQEFKIHEWIKTGEHTNNDGDVKPDYDFFISRTDPSIGESYDELEGRLGSQPRLRFLGVAVELVPITETSTGRGGKTTENIVGFEVATDSYTSKNDDDVEIEVEYPCIGVISLSASNFWGWLGNYAAKGDVNSTVMNVTRQGGDKDTRYDFIPLAGNEVDLSAVLELADGLSYIRETDDYDEVVAEASNIEDSIESAQVIADYLLATRIAELSDGERYHTVVPAIEELPPSKWGKKRGKGAGKGGAAKKSSRATRATGRASSRAKVNDAEPIETSSDHPQGDEGNRGDDGFNKLRQRARARAQAATEAE